MPHKVSRGGAWLRCFLVTAPAVIAFLLSDASFRQNATPQTALFLGAFAVVCSNIHNWLDQSHSQSKQPSPPPARRETPSP